MSTTSFKNITRDDVIRAIDYFDNNQIDYRKPRNTFLKFNRKLYPAKLIRKLSYELKFNTQISSEDLNGGQETVRFFERLGFEMEYKPRHINTHPKKIKSLGKKEELKIGLYNQTNAYKNIKSFNHMKEVIKNSDVDLLVFPEFCFFPFLENFNNTDIYDQEERDLLIKQVLNLSKELGTAIVINSFDKNQFILTIYANENAIDEDKIRFHFKHTYTENSYFDLTGKEEFYKDQYNPVDLNGWKVGFSICFDMLLPIFDKIKKENGAEIIINSSGGNVVRSKWINNLRTRALENELYYFTTMGEGKPSKTVITGSTPEGLQITSEEIGDDVSGLIKIFNLRDKNINTHEFTNEIKPSLNKKPNFTFNLNELEKLRTEYIQIDENIFLKEYNNANIIFFLGDNNEIFKPDLLLNKMFSPKLASIPNKKFILINQWDYFDESMYRNKLQPVLRTRATENFSAVLFISPDKKQGFQSTLNKYSQIIPIINDQIDLDLNRMSGPETFWQNQKSGKKRLERFKENLYSFPTQ